ncbi:MAG: HAD-IA family hydrolase [Chloroflexi bacterium]|nr:HAD-IA family hydrolase [Chloroflexota bacterium]
MGRPLDLQAVRVQRRMRDEELLAQQTIMPGVLAYLRTAKQLGLKTAVASGSSHAWVDSLLARLEISHLFDAVCCCDDVGGKTKPNPAVYLAALAALNVSAAEALALEDSANGAEAARAAGIFCVVVPNELTSQMVFNAADYRLSSLADMPLKQLLSHISANGAPI